KENADSNKLLLNRERDRMRHQEKRKLETAEERSQRLAKAREYARKKRKHILEPSEQENNQMVTETEAQPENPFVQQLSDDDRKRLNKFRTEMNNCAHRLCPTCKERFPSITLVMGECRCCYSEKGEIKKFSAENNMDPGDVPEELKDDDFQNNEDEILDVEGGQLINDNEDVITQEPLQFRNILMRLRDGESTIEDWKILSTRFKGPIARIHAVHTGGKEASKADSDVTKGLESQILLAKGAHVMLRTNLCVEAGLVNGVIGTVHDILFEENRGPPFLPIAVFIEFSAYNGPAIVSTEGKRIILIPPIRRS
ncbi:1429_t:CDS:2, partial [Racocetra fulgida]